MQNCLSRMSVWMNSVRHCWTSATSVTYATAHHDGVPRLELIDPGVPNARV